MSGDSSSRVEKQGWIGRLSPRRRALHVQITLAVCLLVAGVFALHGWLNDPHQLLEAQKEAEARRLGDLISAIVVKEMLAGQPWRVQEHLDLLQSQEDVERILVLDQNNHLTFGSEAEKIGQRYDVQEHETCASCHRDQNRPLGSIVRELESGHRVFSYGYCLEQERACIQCHSSKAKHLGRVLFDISLSDADHALLRADTRLAVSAILLILLVSVSVYGVTNLLVRRPVSGLVRAVEEIERGEFEPKYPTPRSDELGALTGGIRRMAARLGGLIQFQEKEIEIRSEKLWRAQEQLRREQELASLGRMMGGVAHEIGNPSAAISALAQVIEHQSRDENVKDAAGEILTHVDRIANMVRDLTQTFRFAPEPEEGLDLSDAIPAAVRVAGFGGRIHSGIQVELEIEESCPRAWIAEEHLVQILSNLVQNSADALGSTGRIAVRAQARATGLEILVEDSGPGIDADQLEKVLEPFFTTKPNGSGTGLGLWVCQTLVERWGGRLGVQSEPGKGTLITVWLPAAAAEEPIDAIPHPDRR